jgi:hypothetical protein
MEHVQPEGCKHGSMRAGLVVAATVLAVCGGSGSAASGGGASASASLPQDPCQLVTVEEVEAATW